MNNGGVAQQMSAKYPGPENGVTGRASARSVPIEESGRLINEGHWFESSRRCHKYEPKEFSFSVKDPEPVRQANFERVRVAIALLLVPVGVWLAACIILMTMGAA